MKYTIIGGINGVGKSTVYSMLSDAEKLALGERVNVDEIASSLGDWRDSEIQIAAGKQAVRKIKGCLVSGQDFHQETTLAGRSIIKTVKTAKVKGFEICLWYIYVSHVDIAKERVLGRVADGGHGIHEDIIERRSVTSLETLKEIVPLCDELRVYNNTTVFTPVARVMSGKLKILDKCIPSHILYPLGGSYATNATVSN